MRTILMSVKRFMVFFLCTMVLTSMIPMNAHADMGPKPSVVIEIEGLEDEVYYGTLLSERSSNGPLDVMNESDLEAKQDEEEYEIWKAFVEYENYQCFSKYWI